MAVPGKDDRVLTLGAPYAYGPIPTGAEHQPSHCTEFGVIQDPPET
jgi:hypothetical protein